MTAIANAYRAALAARLRDDLAGDVPAADLEGIVNEIVSRVEVSPEGQPISDVRRTLSEFRASEGFWFREAAPETAAPASSGNLTRDALAARANTKKPAVTASQQAALDAIQANPWMTGNMTQQMLLSKFNPDKAARFRSEASR